MSERQLEMEQQQDDAIIGVAFRRSLVVFALIALVAIAAWWWVNRPNTQTTDVDEAGLTAPGQLTSEPTATQPEPKFSEAAEDSGLDFEFVTGAYGERLLPETMVGGVGFLDFDNDGDQDILTVGGNFWPWDPQQQQLDQTLGLFANDGAGRFTRVDQELRLISNAYGMGLAFGDYDSDGDVDVFITAVGGNQLFENLGGTGFQEVTEAAGVAGPDDAWSTGAAFFDADKDGLLDLVVANYVSWNRDLDREVDYQLVGIGRAYGPPTNFPGTQLLYYRNLGQGRFEERAEQAGLHVVNPASGAPVAKALAVVPAHLNDDDSLDLVVANDTTRNFAFINLGDGNFEERGAELGLAFDNTGKATGAMGVDIARPFADDVTAVAIGNFANEMTSFYLTEPGLGAYTDDAVITGIGPDSRKALSFGVFFFDFDLDGRLDFFQANGHVENDINRVQPSQHYAQSAQLFWNCGWDCERPFVPFVNEQLGAIAEPVVGRGAAFADIDNDGDLDVLLAALGDKVRLYRNDADHQHNWLRVSLQPAHQAIGARISVRTGEMTQRRMVSPTRSYLAQTELTQTFGLGDWSQDVSVRVEWPNGQVQQFDQVAIAQTFVVTAP